MTQHDSFPEEMHNPAPELSRRAREAKKNEAPGMDQIFSKVFGDVRARSMLNRHSGAWMELRG